MTLDSTLRSVTDSKREEIHVATEGDTVLDAVRKMSSRQIGALVVMDRDGQIAGIISERDIMTRLVAEERDPASTRVGEIMTPAPMLADASMTVAQAMRKVLDQHIRHLPLVTGNRLEGIVSSRDLMAWALRAQEAEIKEITTRSSAIINKYKLLLIMVGIAALILVIAKLMG